MQIITKYRDFLESIIEIPTKINLMVRLETNPGKFELVHLKMGLQPKIDVDISITNKYSRSLEFNIKFDKYDETFLYYINQYDGPSKLINLLNSRFYKIVNDIIIKEERWDILEYEELKAKKKWAETLKSSNFKVIRHD